VSQRRRGRGALWSSLAVLGLVAVGALLAPLVAPAPPAHQDLERRLEGPSLAHPFGVDELGRDILSRLLYGARVSMAVGLAVVLLAGAVGTLLGLVAGYAGGRVDNLVMRVVDVVLAFPGILLAIALVAVLGPALRHVVLGLVAIGWVGYARLVRGQVLQLRELEFVAAAQALGLPGRLIVLRHVLPNVLPTLFVQASLSMAGAILAEAGLSFLGLGIQPPTPSWGAMVNSGRGHLVEAPHLALFPGLAIFATVMALNFLGDALSERLDPRSAR
jgi:peptide/nickel transport system permease protein